MLLRFRTIPHRLKISLAPRIRAAQVEDRAPGSTAKPPPFSQKPSHEAKRSCAYSELAIPHRLTTLYAETGTW